MAKLAISLKSISVSLGAAALLLAPAAMANPSGLPMKDGQPVSIADLVEVVSPATVNIISIENGTAATGGSMGQGSGFIITANGNVVTNYHVIEGADEIRIIFASGDEFPARIVGTDEETDLAVLKIQSEYSFPYVEFYRGKPVRIGDWVLAIGNPLGIGQSSSVGIISAIGRDAEGSGSFVDYIQTDAVINRGNSGGPLFNLEGKVVAVNSAIFSPTGASIGIGYAIPHEVAESVVYEILTNGRVERGFLGASLRTGEATWDNRPGVKQSAATVEGIAPNGPAAASGLQVEDIILNIEGSAVKSGAEATQKIARYRAGNTITLDVLRGNQTIQVPVTLGRRPSKDRVDAMAGNVISGGVSQAPTAPSSDTGLGLVDISSSFRDSVGMPRNQVGVYVDTVAPGSNAARKGIRSGMILLEMDQKPIASVAMWEQMISKAKGQGKSSVLLKVRTLNGSENFVGLPI